MLNESVEEVSVAGEALIPTIAARHDANLRRWKPLAYPFTERRDLFHVHRRLVRLVYKVNRAVPPVVELVPQLYPLHRHTLRRQ